MFFRGTQIQRHGHGRCVLLTKHGLSSNSAKFSSSRAFAPSETILHTSGSCVATHTWQVRDAVDCKDRIPFHVTRARCLAHLPEMLMRDSRRAFGLSLVERLEQSNQHPRQIRTT